MTHFPLNVQRFLKNDQLKEDSKLTFQKKYHKDHSHLHASRKVSFCYCPWALL